MSEKPDGGEPSYDHGLRLRMRGEERRILSQHEQLGELFDQVMASVNSGATKKAIGDFLLFTTALEAHMAVEERIYFPALHGLRNDVGDELVALMKEHEVIRSSLVDVKARMLNQVGEDARSGLSDLADLVDRHESEEESLLARITEAPVMSTGHTSLEGQS